MIPKICVEQPNNFTDLDQEEQNWRYCMLFLQKILQIHNSLNSMVLHKTRTILAHRRKPKISIYFHSIGL